MAESLIPFTGGAGVPAYLQGASGQSTLDEQTLGGAVDVITQRDGAIVVVRDGIKSQPQMSIDVVVLDAMPRGRAVYRAYYEGVWKEGDTAPPACYSADGVHPSSHATTPQCNACDTCPKNQPGSGTNGEGRACSFFKHVAVAVYPQLDTVYRLKVASRSLFNKDVNGVDSPLGGKAWGFTSFAKLLQNMKTPWEAVVTRISLPKGQTHGFFFTPVGYATAEQFNEVKQLQVDTDLSDILTVEVHGATPSADAPASAGQLPPPPPASNLEGRDKWLASPALPADVKAWVKQVDDNTALQYLSSNYPNVI